MNFNKLNLNSWSRKKYFEHYFSTVPCTYSLCVNIDITNLMVVVKHNNLRFFPTFLYGVSHIVNLHEEFRMSINETNSLGYYDCINPCYPVFHNNIENFTNIWTEYNSDFLTFYDSYLKDLDLYGHNNEIIAKPVKESNIFNVSCIPWTSFVGLNLNLQKGYDYLLPIFTVGRYLDGDKILIPLAIQVHHAVCDGFHIARFINELQAWADNFSL